MAVQHQEVVLLGTPVCRGIAIGHPFYIAPSEDHVQEKSVAPEAIDAELMRYRRALTKECEDVKRLLARLQMEKIADGAAILEGHLQIMQDPLLTTDIEEQIRKTSKNAEYVFHSVVNEYKRKFDSLADPFFQERFKDIEGISKRIIVHLRDDTPISLSHLPANSILFAPCLSALDTAEADSNRIAGFVTQSGGVTSHAAIVARARGVPYISNIDIDCVDVPKDGWVIIDGRTGEMILHPTSETLAKYRRLSEQLSTHMEKLTDQGGLEAETYDGYKVRLSANIEMFHDLDLFRHHGGCGIGLLRTESAFLSKDTFPGEEEQYAIYRHFVESVKGLPIVIRTFDVGGDKNFIGQKTVIESNPFLGCRAIRFLLKEREIFKTQLKAILRASVGGDVSIMFPMVSALSELSQAKALLEEVRVELSAKGIPFAPKVPVGCMIEVPSAALIADVLAKECDFLSIGTNDLVQYALAVDRSNNALSTLYTPSHPSVIRLIRLIVSEANHCGIPVTVCGEVAADPRFAPLLLGLGVHELSVASRYLPIVKNSIRNTSIVAASKLAERALALSTAEEIEELITQDYRRSVPEDCFYNC